MNDVLFSGPQSLRDRSERLAFWATTICALPAALLIGYLLHEKIGASQVALFIVIAMVYVTLARGRLLGHSVRVNERQYPRVLAIVKSACASLEIPMPLVFVREDILVPVAALGFGEPYALVLSSHWTEVYRDDEIAFMIGRELGHVAAGHTRFLSLLSVNGRENALISLIFGAWLRRCTLTCDKVGLLCCGSLDASIAAIAVSEFHEFGRKVDYQAFAEQLADTQADTISRWGAWLGAEPYATTRIAALRHFMESPQYAAAREWFDRKHSDSPPMLTEPGASTVQSGDCAGWWRRFAALAIDAVLVLAIITSFSGNGVSDAPLGVRAEQVRSAALNAVAAAPSAVPSHPAGRPTTPARGAQRFGPIEFAQTQLPKLHVLGVTIEPNIINPDTGSGKTLWFAVYMAVLVALAGQTFGMMIAGLRVTTLDFQRPGIWRTIGRYAIVFALWPVILLLSVVWRRVLLHDRWTATRVVKVERVVARAAAPVQS